MKKYFKVVAFFGHQPVTSFCIKSEKCKSAVKSNLEFFFLKTPWVFVVAPMGRKQSLFLKEYETVDEVVKHLEDSLTCEK